MSIFGGMSTIRRPLAGMRRRKTRRKIAGKGFMDFMRSVGSTVGPALGGIAKDLAVGLIKKKIGLGRKRRRVVRRKKTGRGIIGDLLGAVLGGRKRKVIRRRRMLV